jgi:hypothetical protein
MKRPTDCTDDERAMLHDLVHVLVLKLNDQRERAEHAERRLDCANERIRLLTGVAYGAI